MERSELISKLSKAANETMPEIYDKILMAAKADGLIGKTTGAKALSENAPSGSGAVKSVAGAAVKNRVIAVVATVLACAVAVTAVAVPVALSAKGGLDDGSQIEAPEGNGSTGETGGGTGSQTPSDPTTPNEPHVHFYGEWLVTTLATCTDDGEQERVCSCGDKETEKINSTGHNFNSFQVCENCWCSLGFEYTEVEGGYSVAIGKVTDKNIVIPSEYKGQPIIAVKSSGFENCKFIESVVIPEGVKRIDAWAFKNCTALKTVSMPESLDIIGEFAFDGCSKIEDVVIPKNVTEIQAGAFRACTSVFRVEIPDSVIILGREAFYGCTSLARVNVGKNVREINDQTFKDCINLQEIHIFGTETLVYRCVENCTNLTVIRYFGTKSDWSSMVNMAMTIAGYTTTMDWCYGAGNFSVYCEDGELKMGETV